MTQRPEWGGEPRSLPRSRAFVVQFTGDTEPPMNRFCGRIEHLESTRSTRFDSLDELMAFVTEILRRAEAES